MKAIGTTLWHSLLLSVMLLAGFSGVSYSSPKKKPKAYRDINAIGHRAIGFQFGLGNWYSLDREKQIGAQLSAEYEKSTPLIHDGATQAYVDRLAQTISQNSDTQFPITTRILDSEDSFALTFPGGYQYVSRGLLLQMESEGEVAAAIARGIAHTSLRSATGLITRANLTRAANVPVIFAGTAGPTGSSTSDKDFTLPLIALKRSRDDESAADYFGIQYLYKSGYSPECFIRFIQKVWPSQAQTTSKAFSPFPQLPERLEALRGEIQVILTQRNTAITNSTSLKTFREPLLTLASVPKPLPQKTTLLRSEP